MSSGRAIMSRQLFHFRHGLVNGVIAGSRRSGAISVSSTFQLVKGPDQLVVDGSLTNYPGGGGRGHHYHYNVTVPAQVNLFSSWTATAGFHSGSPACVSYKTPDSLTSQSQASPFNRKHDNPVSQKLLSARTTEEIVSVLEQEAELMDVITVSVAVDVLFDALKSETGLTVKVKHQLLTSVGVQKLCKLLRNSGPRMDPGDLINATKLLSFMAVPGNHQTYQVLLKLISKHANSLDLQQIMYMHFLLEKGDTDSKSSLSKALEFALPVVFESQLSTQLERTDPFAISDCLHYATKHKLSEKSINLLVDAALRIAERIPVKNTMSIMWSLCDVNFDSPSHAPLATWGFKKISDSIDNFKMSDLSTLIGKASKRFNRTPARYLYNEYFLDAYCQRFLNEKGRQLDTLWLAKHLSTFRHVNIDVVDRVGEIIATNPSPLLNDDYLFMLLMRAFSNFNYKPESWSAFSSLLLEHPLLSVTKKNFGFSEILLAIDFLALELFPENLIRVIYSGDGLTILEEFQGRQHPIKLALLYNAVKVLYPAYRGPLPPVTMIENWIELSRASNANKQYPLMSALQTGLGGESYVINGLYHDGIHIDHGIVMRKGGYPVAVNSQSDSQSDCLSSIAKPAESVMVLVKGITKDLYSNNTRRIRGMGALEIRILEGLGHPVVAVDLEKWMELPDHEKIPFLMHRIREKMEHLQWNQNWGDVIPP